MEIGGGAESTAKGILKEIDIQALDLERHSKGHESGERMKQQDSITLADDAIFPPRERKASSECFVFLR